MADDITVTIDTAQIEAALSALPERVSGRILKQALQQAANVVQDAIVTLAPQRTDEPTPGSNSLPPGILKADIQTNVRITSRDGAVARVGPTDLTAHKARWIENGFMLTTHGRKRYRRQIKQIPGVHFMAGGFDEAAPRALSVLTESLREALTARGALNETPQSEE